MAQQARTFCPPSKEYDELIALLQEKEAIFTKTKPTIPGSQLLISALQDLTQKLMTIYKILPKK